jgi:PBP1b-binding outer membrane lipoprotein LpoB
MRHFKFKRLFIIIYLFILFLTGCAKPWQPKIEYNKDTAVGVSVGDQFEDSIDISISIDIGTDSVPIFQIMKFKILIR